MKTNIAGIRIRNMALTAVVILSASCLDYTVKTTVNKDGSIYRQYSVRGDSAEVFSGSLLVPSGEPWYIRHEYEHKDKKDTSSEKSQYVYQASRTFRNVQELNDWLNSDTSQSHVGVTIELKRGFKWFYTYYEYNETYPMSFPFQKIPVDSFLTELEQSIIKEDGKVVYSPADHQMIWKKNSSTFRYTPADSMEIKRITEKCEEKMLRWMTASFIEEFITTLESDFGDRPATREIRSKADQFTAVIYEKVRKNYFDTVDFQWLVNTGDSLIHSHALKELYTSNQAAFIPINEKIKQMDIMDNDDDYYQSLTMPGTVYSANADDCKGEVLNWDFGPFSFLMKDYSMMASSRVAHPWIMAFTGIIAVFLLIILIMKRKKQPERT